MSVTIQQGARGSVSIAGRGVAVLQATPAQVEIARVGTQGVPGPVGPAFEGYGAVDYSDANDGVGLILPAGGPVWIQRSLVASAPNNTLRGGFGGHAFWDDATKLVRSLRLREVLRGSIAMRVEPDLIGGVLTLALVTAAPAPITVWQWVRALTAGVGQAEAIRVPFEVYVRSSFHTYGAKFMLTSSVPATVTLFSPEFVPLSMGPAA